MSQQQLEAIIIIIVPDCLTFLLPPDSLELTDLNSCLLEELVLHNCYQLARQYWQQEAQKNLKHPCVNLDFICSPEETCNNWKLLLCDCQAGTQPDSQKGVHSRGLSIKINVHLCPNFLSASRILFVACQVKKI